MNEKEWGNRIEKTVGFFPYGVKNEIIHLISGVKEGSSRLSEIRLRAYGRSTVIFDDAVFPLGASVDGETLSELLSSLCRDSLYAYRDTVIKGYLPLPYGVRVGICASLSYDGGRAVGVTDVTSLVFRFPIGTCSVTQELTQAFCEYSPRGTVIFSAPGVGKTTAIRSLARALGSSPIFKRVAVVDQKFEFIHEDYRGCDVEILGGYNRRDGIDLALSYLSPEVIMVDEIGMRDGEALTRAVGCGVPVIATVHASDFEGAKARLDSLGVSSSLFELMIGLYKSGRERTLRVYENFQKTEEDTVRLWNIP